VHAVPREIPVRTVQAAADQGEALGLYTNADTLELLSTDLVVHIRLCTTGLAFTLKRMLSVTLILQTQFTCVTDRLLL
jgi:hypothetical protein